jgi:hypothetical protein
MKFKKFTSAVKPPEEEVFIKLQDDLSVDLVDNEGQVLYDGHIGRFVPALSGRLKFKRFQKVNKKYVFTNSDGVLICTPTMYTR